MGRRKQRREEFESPDQIPDWSNEHEYLVSELRLLQESPIPWIAAIPKMVETLELTRKEICVILSQFREVRKEATEGSDLRYHSEWSARVRSLDLAKDPRDPFSPREVVFDPLQARQMADIVRQMMKEDQQETRTATRAVLRFPR